MTEKKPKPQPDPCRFVTVSGNGKCIASFPTEKEAEAYLNKTLPLKATVWQRPEDSVQYFKCATFYNNGINGVTYSRV